MPWNELWNCWAQQTKAKLDQGQVLTGQTAPSLGTSVGLLVCKQLAEQELKPQLTVISQDKPSVVHSTLHGPSSLQFNTAFLQLSRFVHLRVHAWPDGQLKVVPSHAPLPLQSMTQSALGGQVINP
jgi:hypothetical protein